MGYGEDISIKELAEKIKDVVPNIKTGADPVIVGKHIIKERVKEKISNKKPVDKKHNF